MDELSNLAHVRYLTETLGHRGSTTQNEAEAAAYVHDLLVCMGVSDVRTETFRGGVTLWRPFIVCLVLGLAAGALYATNAFWMRPLAAALSGCAFWWLYREVNFEDNPVRRLLPKGASRNVIAGFPPADLPRRRVIVVGHLDSGQTPILFRSQLLLLVFVALAFLTVAGLAANSVLYLASVVAGRPILDSLIVIGIALQAVALAFAIQAELSAYTQGANDNASSVGVALGVAARAARAPLRHTEITVLFSGCEEVGCYGMLDFIARHGSELHNACFVVLEGVGCGELHYGAREGMLGAYLSDPELIEIVRAVGVRRPELTARPLVLRAGYTENGVVVKNGLRGITLLAMSRGGLFTHLPHWHQPDDVYANLEPATLARAEELVWKILREMDGRGS